MNCADAPIAFSVWLPGIIVIAVKSRAPPTPPVATVRLAVPTTLPVDEVMVAVMEVVPMPTAVATPEALTVATSVLLDAQVTPVVMFCVFEGCPATDIGLGRRELGRAPNRPDAGRSWSHLNQA